MGGPDVDDREFAALGQGRHQVIGLLDIDGLKHIAGLQDDVAGVLEIIAHPFTAEAEDGHGGMVDIAGAGGVVIAVIGRPQTPHKGLVQVHERTAPVREEHRARTVFRHNLL